MDKKVIINYHFCRCIPSIYFICICNPYSTSFSTSQLGNKDEAMSNYISALHTYEDVQGKKSTSYVSTLANLGNKK